MNEIVQFQLKDVVVDVTESKILYSRYYIASKTLEIYMEGGDIIALEMNYSTFQKFDEAREKRAIIEDTDYDA